MRTPTQRARRLAAPMAAIVLVLGLALMVDRPALASTNDCQTYTSVVERQLHIPNGLLLAISLVESGVDGVPQPNALSFGLRSLVAHSPEDAVRRLYGRNGQLRSDAFVGCMQLSVHHHHAAFHPLVKIMEPRYNIWYAGHYLVELRQQTGNWSRAVARYQGGPPKQAHRYVCRVWNHLAELDWSSAKTLEPRRCGEMSPPEIAPKTRRAFQQAQVAAAPE